MNNFINLLFCGVFLITCCAVNQTTGSKNILPVKQSEYQGIKYVSGGIGSDEREKIAAIGKSYSLKLVFAVEGGEYISGVKVKVLDSAGELVIDALSDGPWFFIELPSGKYTITAKKFGKEKQSEVSIKKGQKQITLRFYWKK